MIIGIDASRANDKKKTGVGWYAYFVIQELKRFKIQDSKLKDLHFILYVNRPLQGELGELPDNWKVKVLRWPPKRLWTQIRLSWEMLIHPPDVLFIPAHVFPIIHPKKTVMMIHDIAASRFPESYNWFERWYTLWSAKYALKKLWRIIVPSEFTKIELERFKIEDSRLKIFVVYHGYDEKYRIIKDETNIKQILNKYNITKPFIMTVGRLEEKKNTWRLIEAFNQIRHNLESLILSLVLIGNPGHGYEKVKQEINNSPYKHDIITPGWVDAEDMPYLMNAAEVFVFPSLYEGFGIPILEAFACGTPVVASKGSSLEEIGGEACIYVHPLDIDDIARGISEIIQDNALKMQKIELGLKRVKEFSWEKCAKETVDILCG